MLQLRDIIFEYCRDPSYREKSRFCVYFPDIFKLGSRIKHLFPHNPSRDWLSRRDPGKIPPGSRLYFHLGNLCKNHEVTLSRQPTVGYWWNFICRILALTFNLNVESRLAQQKLGHKVKKKKRLYRLFLRYHSPNLNETSVILMILSAKIAKTTLSGKVLGQTLYNRSLISLRQHC